MKSWIVHAFVAWELSCAEPLSVPDLKGSAPQQLRPDLFGYSIEPSSLGAFVASDLTRNLLDTIRDISGVAVPLRIGGTTADEITVVPRVDTPSGYNSSDEGSSGGNNGAAYIELAPRWYTTWADYFSNDTSFTYTLNFRNRSSDWGNAQKEASAILKVLGPRLKRFEFGNEVDHWINKHWRGRAWGVINYTRQWRRLRTLIRQLPGFKSATLKPQFQAASFADPPAFPDQADEVDDFTIANLTQKAGLINDDGSISGYAVHLYPQSTCDAARESRISLDLLSNHSVLYTNVSQYIDSQKAATEAGASLVIGETNSVSCGGRSGVSDTFGAALWTLDYALMAASLGIPQVYFHLGSQSEYSAFTPLPYVYKNESLQAGVRANFYAHVFAANVVKGLSNGETATISAISRANASDLSGYAIRKGGELQKLVFLDMSVWNSSTGVSNPSTLRAYDSRSTSPGNRPSRSLNIQTDWKEGTQLQGVPMQAPGTNSKSEASVGGRSVDIESGKLVGTFQAMNFTVGRRGRLRIDMHSASALLLTASSA